MSIAVRNAREEDRPAILALVPRLRAFGAPELRPVEDLDRAEAEALSRALTALPENAVLLVAELDAQVAGVAYAESATDYFTKERHGHLGILIVAEHAEGRGVGRALLGAIDQWAKSRGYRFVTLNVFEGNAHARKVYERAGYTIDTLKYVKRL